MPGRPIRFVRRDRIIEVDGISPTTSVLSWLREHARETGTKEGCNEGDCGACTVLVGELADADVRWRPINSCIAPLPTLDGKALLTVEDLAGEHPAQRALVDCHGSQCGFCTPGFVMSLAGCLERHRREGAPLDRRTLADDLAGNLCRCTGYRPILDAGERMAGAADHPLATPATRECLNTLAADPPLDYEAAGQHFAAPRTLEALADELIRRPQARILGGSTDIGLWVNKQLRQLDDLVYVGRVAALAAIGRSDGWLRIGAGASLEAAWGALGEEWPALREMGQRFASRPVREAGTMGGNVANGSPIGDSAPVLIALGARLVLHRGAARRTLALEDFYLGYLKNALGAGEFVEAIEVPLPRPGEVVRAYKVSKRHDSDISALACGLWLRCEGDTIAAARLAFGGMAAIVRRAAAAEAALCGRRWDAEAARAAMAAIADDFTPLTDLRASAAYRAKVASNLLWRFWLQTRAADPLPEAATSVWSFA